VKAELNTDTIRLLQRILDQKHVVYRGGRVVGKVTALETELEKEVRSHLKKLKEK